QHYVDREDAGVHGVVVRAQERRGEGYPREYGEPLLLGVLRSKEVRRVEEEHREDPPRLQQLLARDEGHYERRHGCGEGRADYGRLLPVRVVQEQEYDEYQQRRGYRRVYPADIAHERMAYRVGWRVGYLVPVCLKVRHYRLYPVRRSVDGGGPCRVVVEPLVAVYQ